MQELRAGLPSYEVRAYTPVLSTCTELMAACLSRSATGRTHLCLLLCWPVEVLVAPSSIKGWGTGLWRQAWALTAIS